MKKVLLSSIFAVALIATVGFGVNKSMKSDANLSDLALTNVEALASNEGGATPCGGPKSDSGMCKSVNTVNCRDLFGCQ